MVPAASDAGASPLGFPSSSVTVAGAGRSSSRRQKAIFFSSGPDRAGGWPRWNPPAVRRSATCALEPVLEQHRAQRVAGYRKRYLPKLLATQRVGALCLPIPCRSDRSGRNGLYDRRGARRFNVLWRAAPTLHHQWPGGLVLSFNAKTDKTKGRRHFVSAFIVEKYCSGIKVGGRSSTRLAFVAAPPAEFACSTMPCVPAAIASATRTPGVSVLIRLARLSEHRLADQSSAMANARFALALDLRPETAKQFGKLIGDFHWWHAARRHVHGDRTDADYCYAHWRRLMTSRSAVVERRTSTN